MQPIIENSRLLSDFAYNSEIFKTESPECDVFDFEEKKIPSRKLVGGVHCPSGSAAALLSDLILDCSIVRVTILPF